MNKCTYDSDCERMQVCVNNVCEHEDLFTNNPIEIFTNTIFVFFVGFTTCGNFGSAAIQVCLLMGLLNYQRKESAAIGQALLVGISFGTWLKTRAKKHPLKKHYSLIDYKLCCLLLPCLQAGLLGGIHLRNFLPAFVLSLFLAIQIIFVMMKTTMKWRQVKSLEDAQKKVAEEVASQASAHNGEAQATLPKLLTMKSMKTDTEDVHINFDLIFKTMAKSQYRELYIKYLPPDMQQSTFERLNKEEQEKVKDYLVTQLGEQKVLELQKKCEQDEQAATQAQINDSKVMESSQVVPDRQTVMALYQYGQPKMELSFMTVISILNIINLLFMGGKHFGSVIGIPACSTLYWILFYNQFIMNTVFYFIQSYFLKLKSDREYSKALEQYMRNESFLNEKPKGRVEIPITLKSATIIFLVGLSGGFLMGFIGIGASILLVFVLIRYQINLASLMATLPLMIAFSCLLGSLIQVMTGYLAWDAALFYGAMCLVGSFLISPYFQGFFDRIKMTSNLILTALIFQTGLLIVYLLIWLPTINIHQFSQYIKTTAIC